MYFTIFRRTAHSGSCILPPVNSRSYAGIGSVSCDNKTYSSIFSWIHIFSLCTHPFFLIILLIIMYAFFFQSFLLAISLLIGFPFRENFSSYSVMIFPAFISSWWCRSYVYFSRYQPASFTCSSEKLNNSVLSVLNSTLPPCARTVSYTHLTLPTSFTV